jgi:hypothetical protein
LSPSACETTLIGGVFTIIGVLIGGFIGYYFSTRLINRQDFNKAATEFRNTFIVQINFLKYNVNSGSGDTSNIGEYLKAYYVKSHLIAFEVFRNFLSVSERKAIDVVWTEYCNFKQYSDKNNQKEARELALKNLDGVLKFAKHK